MMSEVNTQFVFRTAWGDVRISDMPLNLAHRVESAPRRKDGLPDMRFSESRKAIKETENFALERAMKRAEGIA